MVFKFPAISERVTPLTQDVNLETLINEYTKRYPEEKVVKVTFDNTDQGVILHFEGVIKSRTFLWRGEPICDTLAVTEI